MSRRMFKYISREHFLLTKLLTYYASVCSYKAVILAIKLARTGEKHSASRHVDTHGECLCSKQGLG